MSGKSMHVTEENILLNQCKDKNVVEFSSWLKKYLSGKLLRQSVSEGLGMGGDGGHWSQKNHSQQTPFCSGSCLQHKINITLSLTEEAKSKWFL